MEWTADASAGAWLRERLDAEAVDMHVVVPRGFPAYVRIFHPAHRERPIGEPWPGLPYDAHRAEWEAFQARSPETIEEQVSWAETAGAMGTVMHAGAQWDRIVAPGRIVENEDGPRDRDGWRYAEPPIGGLEVDVLAAVAGHLVEHTTTPDAGMAGIWEGWGRLLGYHGKGPSSRAFFGWGGDPHHAAMLSRSVHDAFNNVFRRATWQEGILSREISEGPRLQLPDRGHVLFTAAPREFADPAWILGAPWHDRESEGHGFPPSAQSPSLVWPDDHAWVLVSEVDFDSTIVAGAEALIRAICSDERIEALPIAEGTRLTWNVDEVNR
ncbi:hypothetical protein [Microbacterium sp.]|uniref:hypothetical protein n=1 Tax=Microbacterium sp. TaxID=51671 RepID=UPI0028126C6A|nr:hypothetical protein [Microbacterium sp.]